MKLTKFFLCICTAVMGLTVLMACSSKDDKEPAGNELSISSVTNQGKFTHTGGELIIVINASAEPKVYQRADWIKNCEHTTNGKVHTYSFQVTENTGKERSERISFVLGDKTEVAEIKQEAAPEKPYEPTNYMALGLGWNLGNHFDAYVNGVADETSWGNKATTQALFNKLAADGLKTVRIPVTWLGKVGNAPDYKIDAAWLNRVYEVVGYAEKAGLNVIINIHHDGADTGKWLDVKKASTDAEFYNGMMAQFKAMWTQIANKFADKGDFLVFEPFNELHDGSWGWGDNRKDGGKQYQIVNELNQAFVDVVRATGGKNATRWLSAVGYCTNPDLTMENLKLPNDPTPGRQMVAVHFYDPNTFTLEATKTDWGHTGKAANKESWGNEDNVRNIFGELKSKYSDLGIPVYIGEAGCVHHSTDRGETFRKYYLEYVAKAARENGLGLIIWDNGSTGAGKECHGYYNHATGDYINNSEEIIKVLIRGYFTEDAAYTLQSVYDSAPKI